MTNYLVRVELHNAQRSDYDVLHQAMIIRGFGRTIQADNGRLYELPPAEYSFFGNDNDALNVEVLAATAAATTGLRYAVLAVDWKAAAWVGLNEVPNPLNILAGLPR